MRDERGRKGRKVEKKARECNIERAEEKKE